MTQRNIKLVVAYEGTAYHGFQRQNNAVSIQQILEERLEKLFGHPIKITGAGRTDAGVHAYGQVINFLTCGSIPTDKIPVAARGLLPDDIVIMEAEEVDSGFHARGSAKSKIYTYRLYLKKIADPFLRNMVWQVNWSLDVDAMKEAAKALTGTHDFSAFRAAGGAPVSPIRTIYSIDFSVEGPVLELTFWGNGFLYHTVRNLVGTLVEVGLKKKKPEDMERILDSRNRKMAGMTAPAHGLYLKEVKY